VHFNPGASHLPESCTGVPAGVWALFGRAFDVPRSFVKLSGRFTPKVKHTRRRTGLGEGVMVSLVGRTTKSTKAREGCESVRAFCALSRPLCFKRHPRPGTGDPALSIVHADLPHPPGTSILYYDYPARRPEGGVKWFPGHGRCCHYLSDVLSLSKFSDRESLIGDHNGNDTA
jgi:hypothetical protein